VVQVMGSKRRTRQKYGKARSPPPGKPRGEFMHAGESRAWKPLGFLILRSSMKSADNIGDWNFFGMTPFFA